MITIYLAQAVRVIIQVVLVFLVPAFALAQQSTPAASAVTAPKAVAADVSEKNPFTSHSKFTYGFVKEMLLKSAEKMPEESYGFKPVATVRTFGHIIGHAADAQIAMCAAAMGWTNPRPNFEKSKITKADLIAALKESFAYCDKAYEELNDAKATEMTKLGGGHPMHRLGAMNANQLHAIEHYGNLITYLRMNNIVPPSSEPGFGRQQAQKK
ncbi:MAG TPA: DinB family protein [Thermoanaerobaculia bacterium]|nr:DinB family protein [Thermoanaerobaculia bacterium]